MTIENGLFWGKSWNPIHVKGGGYFCTRISPGCQNCWCYSYNKRFGNGLPFDSRQVEFELDQRILEAPLHWRKPQVITVQWLGDILHEEISVTMIEEVLAIITRSPQHTFLVLTKRAQRLNLLTKDRLRISRTDTWPIKNLWLGVSISTQKEADEKISLLLQTLAAHRFVNLGPCLDEIYITDYLYNHLYNKLDWVCLECESGPGRRRMKLEWARSIVEQCKAAGVPLWIKQLSIVPVTKNSRNYYTKVSKNMSDWPEDLRLRQCPF